jgi:hypothetical protein
MRPAPVPIVEDEEVAAKSDQVLEEVDKRIAAVHVERRAADGDPLVLFRRHLHPMPGYGAFYDVFAVPSARGYTVRLIGRP